MSHHRSRRPTRASIAVPAVLLVLAGCAPTNPEAVSLDRTVDAPVSSVDSSPTGATSPTGGSSPTGQPAEAAEPSETATKAVESGGYRVLTKDTLVPVTLAALEKEPTAHMTMEMRTASAVVTAEGDVRYDGPSPAMAMTIEAPGLGPLEMRVVRGLVYMSLPPVTPVGSYIEIDPKDPNDPYGQSFAALPKQMDPRAAYAVFEEGLRKVTYLGEEDGLHRYRLVIDTAAVARIQGTQLVAGMPKTIPYDVWLDDRNRMTRGVMGMGSQTSMDSTYSDWGKPVNIKAPPANRIVQQPGR